MIWHTTGNRTHYLWRIKYKKMTPTALFIKMVIDRWNGSIVNFNKHLDALTDEQLQKEIVPGKNRGIYLLGHLVAVHDDMLPLLDLGAKLFPELQAPFIQLADKTATEIPSASELRALWNKQCELLQEKFEQLTAAQWFEKHTSVTEEDFAKEPHRNKLNIIITRTSHLQYHTGQLALLN
jgi:DinB superfamily